MEDNSNNNYKVRVVTAQIAVEHIPPPGPHVATPFNSLEEWLTFHCQHETRSEPLSEYMITFTEPPDVLVSLVGYQHGIEQGIPISKIVFHPKQYSWFELPGEQYGGLAREELIEKIHFELKEFFKTEQFKKSFLAHGYNISTNFEEDIWSL